VKKSIRDEARVKRAKVSGADEKSEAIKHHLFAMAEFSKAQTVLFYMSKDTEVITHDMVFHAAATKKIALPVTMGGELRLADLEDDSVLAPGAFGILEPQGRYIDPAKIDLAVIPGLAFDAKGGRIGYGRGYYDKLLSKLDCPVVALAYSEQIFPDVPRECHDVDVDYIITEEGPIACKNN
jgi:5-formyltetrahydrofolate cyclo-ligase